MTAPLLEMRAIDKTFGLAPALTDLSLALYPGEVHGLVGENGAGKSTLIKIMTGVHQPSAGTILIDGAPVTLHSTHDAQVKGVAAVYQEPMVFPDLDVAENVFISDRKQGGLMHWSRLYARAEEVIRRLGVDLDVRRAASGLTLAEQQTVEIARALSLDVRVLILDEPTASLSAHEVERLLSIVRTLRASGVAVLYISHRLDEVFLIADRVTVLRDGRHISTKAIAEVTHDGLIRDMVGRNLAEFAVKTAANPHGEVLLSVRGLGCEGAFWDVSFDLHRGEVLCFAGLVGSRRTDIGLALFGIAPADHGEIRIEGAPVTIGSPQAAKALGIAYVSEDRRKLGLTLAMPVAANVSMATLDTLLDRLGLIDRRAEIAMADSYRRRLAIRSPDVHIETGKLSGGNQQKVMLAKWLEMKPRLLIFDEPTRGIDVGAKVEVHGIIERLAAEGIAIIVISSDLPEVLALADRILVMREGRPMGILAIAEASQEAVARLATGQAALHVPREPAHA